MLRQLTGTKFLPQQSMWPLMRLPLTPGMMNQALPLVTQGKAAVKVTPHIITLPPHHWLQTWNNMSLCKLPTRQLDWISRTRKSLLGRNTTSSWDWKRFLVDGPLRDFPSPHKRLLITLTECWLAVAGRPMQHVQCLRSHFPPSDWLLNFLPCCWQAIRRKKWLPSSGRFWPTPPRSFMTTTQCTFYAPIIGFTPSTRNCCTHRHGTMQRWLVKRTGLAVDWQGYLHILGHQKYMEAICVCYQIFLTGYWRYVLCGYVAGLVSCPLGSLVIRQLQRKEDECRTANPSWVDQSRLDPTSSGELPGDVPHIEARCHCRGKVPLLGRSPGQRRYKSPCSFPMNILWTTGIQRIMLCPQCGPMSPWWGSTICARWLVTTFITCRRSTEYLVCGAMFARGGGYCSSTLRQLGRDGIRWRRERRGSLPTGPINLGMIWRMKSGLMRGESGRPAGTVYGGYVSLVPHCSFLVRKESLRASMTRSEGKSMLYRYSFLEVSKMCQLAERKKGSKSRMLLLAHSCQSLHWTLTISCWRRSESRGCVDSRERLSMFHLFTMIGLGRLLVFLFVCGGGVVFLVLLIDVLDLPVVFFVYLWQLTPRYNDCHYRDDERSMSPKKLRALI